MEYSPILHQLNVVPSLPHVKNKPFVLCIMLSLWVYMIYCCVGYCTTIPPPRLSRTAQHSEVSESDGEPDHQDQGSVGASRDLLNNDNEVDSRAAQYDWVEEDTRGEARAIIQGDHATPGVLNGSESKRLPQAVIIGVKKGGTRALLEFLRAHPDVRAVGAEPHFFDRNYDKGLEWYRELMPPTLEGQLTMEKTPSYFVTKEVPWRIYNMSSSTKLLVVVRDPVTRAVSDYTQTRSKRPDIASFESLVFRNGSAAAVDASWSAVQIGMYAKHLERWRRHFPAAQLLFVSGERLIADPSGEMARVQDFLGLRRAVGERHFHFDAAKGFPCLQRPAGGQPRCLGKTKGRTHPRIPARVLQRLREFYRPHNRRFYQMTGHDFGWD